MIAIRTVAAALTLLALPALATAQSARAVGTVRDLTGKPIKGAIVRALNPEAYPSNITSTTDDKGRFGMIGLRTGAWRFVVDAPGFLRLDTTAGVRVGNQAPLQFALAKDPGPVPNALERNVAQRLQEAATLRDGGQLDQALAAYQDIYAKNPRLSAVNLVVADVYRRKAEQTTDSAAKQTLLDRALDAYNEVLKSDAGNERARAEISSLQSGKN
ncbi:MAG TPA: carboxypeptidase-like regulatory domain-containing protein [Vicinamibacterales bacterium]